MKAKKSANQHNARINEYYYTEHDIEMMYQTREIFSISRMFNDETEDSRPRIGLDGAEIKVALSESLHYEVVVIKNSKTYHVVLD